MDPTFLFLFSVGRALGTHSNIEYIRGHLRFFMCVSCFRAATKARPVICKGNLCSRGTL